MAFLFPGREQDYTLNSLLLLTVQIPSQTLFFQFISSAAISQDSMAPWNHIKASGRCTIYTLAISENSASKKNNQGGN